MPAPKKRRTLKTPYRHYLPAEIVKAAFLAGQGVPSADIALQLGGTTGAKIAKQLHRYGVALPRKGDDDVMQIRWSRRDQRALEAFAEKYPWGAADIIVIIMRVLLAEPVLFANLMDEVDLIEGART